MFLFKNLIKFREDHCSFQIVNEFIVGFWVQFVHGEIWRCRLSALEYFNFSTESLICWTFLYHLQPIVFVKCSELVCMIIEFGLIMRKEYIVRCFENLQYFWQLHSQFCFLYPWMAYNIYEVESYAIQMKIIEQFLDSYHIIIYKDNFI